MVQSLEYAQNADKSQADRYHEMRIKHDEAQRELTNMVKLCNNLKDKQTSYDQQLSDAYQSLGRKEDVTKTMETRYTSKLSEAEQERDRVADEVRLL